MPSTHEGGIFSWRQCSTTDNSYSITYAASCQQDCWQTLRQTHSSDRLFLTRITGSPCWYSSLSWTSVDWPYLTYGILFKSRSRPHCTARILSNGCGQIHRWKCPRYKETRAQWPFWIGLASFLSLRSVSSTLLLLGQSHLWRLGFLSLVQNLKS